ncbi:DUF3320 domain-containing protein [Compostibacter hankyongensis]|uniref:DUF3320 domain-containing protein n=1 Tax=Compostibacter hankyongensis TaxID=1007089 RepID=A0ABP8FQM4_9BACT
MTEDPSQEIVVFDYLPAVSYALYQNHVPVIRTLSIRNATDKEWTNLIIKIEPSDDFAEPLELHTGQLFPGSTFQPEIIQLKLKPVFICSLTEMMTASLKLSIRADEEEVYTKEYDIDLLAYDQWLGKGILPEMLSAFVMPNLPELVPILKSTAGILGKWTDNSALNDYQSQNPDRVKKQMAALYAAIKEKKITYCSVPASFGGAGQRVRLVDTVLATGMGNCLEMSLLYASCLEAMGLHPILVLIKGHAFVGAWLVDDTFPDTVSDDPSLLTKRIASGINEMLLIEATAMNEGQSPTFDDAIQLAVNHFADLSAFDYFIDVHRSRFSGIRPMPLRKKVGEEWQIIDHENSVDQKPEISNPTALAQSVKLNHVQEIHFGKQQLWERKLLDLSLRNNLLNLRISKTSLQFIPVPLNELEDAMAGGDEFQILARPRDWDNPLRSSGVYQSLNSRDPMLQLVRQELKQKRLRVYVSEEDLYAGLTGLYRNARQAMEENGANTLYLAIGLLRWHETPSSERPRFAPILLMPVEIIRKSVKKGFIIRSREEDTVLNITLLEKLRQDFGLALSGLDPLPRDESGVDVKLIFNIIRQTIMSMPRWDVEEQIFLGTFSFSKFIMWNDIHSNADKLKDHPIVAGLTNGSLKDPLDYIQEENLDHKYGYEDLLLPINADATQLRAISAATAGNSFVLHGPPGTGKSQTITNIIANALYHGKRVLFVAEKMAALSVVQSRLAAIGLAPFCLELHSNKARKSEVLAQLQKTMEIVRKHAPDSFKSEAERLNQLRKVLNEHVEVLHKKQVYGYSLYDLFNEYVQYPEAKDDIPFSAGELSTLDREKWHQWIDIAEELQIAAGLCGDASERNPLYGLEPGEYSSQQKEKIRQELGLFIKAREKLNQVLQQVTQILHWPDDSWTDGQLQQFREMINGILQLPEIPESFFQTEHLSDFEEALTPLITAGEQRDKISSALSQKFQATLLDAPAGELLTAWNLASAKWFLPRYFGQKKVKKNLYAFLKTGLITSREVPQILLDTLAYQENNAVLNQHKDYLDEKLGRFWKNGHPVWEQVRQALAGIKALNNHLLQWNADQVTVFTRRQEIGHLFQKGRASFMDNEAGLLQSLDQVIRDEQAKRYDLEKVLGCHLPFERSNAKDEGLEKASLWHAHLDELKNWFNWTQVRKKALALHLESFIAAYEAGAFKTDQMLDSFKKSLVRSLATQIIASSQPLSAFNGQYFAAQITRFRELTNTFTRLTQELLYAELASRVPVFSQGAVATSESGILQKAIKSNGRGMSIRQLFNNIPNLLPRMMPCMLMSPISVAQYLDINSEPFDLILFDEASQMPTSKAVGTIARGKSLIVVGDPKQMPPTSFFSSVHFDEEDSNEDLESILDDCQALSVPSRQLQWHYRSQHESLIAFSNAKYYDNSLFTFPSPDDLATRVHYVPIEGIYDRGKTRQNRAEAEAIVREMVRLLSLPEQERKSIGVVTFSSVQQTLIEDLLNEEFVRNPTLEEANNNASEPLFIKNLENVQGDERDIILFSVCYGPDESGQVSLNFGPLNRDGGWRRLNVAVSRARYLMKIYATLRADQIDLSRTRSEGVAGLKAFLAFAEKGKVALPIPQTAVAEKHTLASLETSVATFLREQGYQVDTHIGCSGYRIDMAVIHPDKPKEYLAGVLFDGYNYLAGQSARDRNVVQSSVLKLLGWKIFRIWALDWWESKEQVMQALLDYLDQQKTLIIPDAPNREIPIAPAPIAETVAPEYQTANLEKEEAIAYNKVATANEQPVPEPVAVPTNQSSAYSVYKPAELPVMTQVTYEDLLAYGSTQTLMQQIRQVIDIEAPVMQTLLCRRVLAAWGVSRLGARIQSRFEQVFSAMQLNTTQDQDGNTCFWKDGQIPGAYTDFRVPGSEAERRNAEDLPAPEVANAVQEILTTQISMPEDDLVRETAKLFQYGRVGGNVETAMRRGIREAIQRGKVKLENGRVVFMG